MWKFSFEYQSKSRVRKSLHNLMLTYNFSTRNMNEILQIPVSVVSNLIHFTQAPWQLQTNLLLIGSFVTSAAVFRKRLTYSRNRREEGTSVIVTAFAKNVCKTYVSSAIASHLKRPFACRHYLLASNVRLICHPTVRSAVFTSSTSLFHSR